MLFDKNLQIRWVKLCHSIGFSQEPTIYLDRLINAYREKPRAYHTVEHIRNCLNELDLVLPLAEYPREVEFALWFHDAIYEPSAVDNEERSADWAVRVLQENALSTVFIAMVKELILDTKHNHQPRSSDGCLMVDIDLAILGSPEPQFVRYESQIRQEYQQVPDALFRAGRAAILQSFLNREAIYHTKRFQERYEAQARANLQKSLSKLQAVL